MARALAASASRAGRKVAFFMRKGADILSKWVGEAERQLRLLFEEAQRQQPAIIFFDEIDGLAPVSCCSALLLCLPHPRVSGVTAAGTSYVPLRAMTADWQERQVSCCAVAQ